MFDTDGEASGIGRVQSVPLRSVWEHEAHAFTPWLAENLDLVSSEIGRPLLELVGQEVSVGPFSLDIEARDQDGRVVIIEN